MAILVESSDPSLRRRRRRATATTEFGAALDALGLQQRRVARWFGVSPRSVRRWQSGDRNLPCGVDVVFRLLVTGVITPTQVEQAVTRTNGSGTPEPPAPRPVEPAPETPVDPGLATVTTAEKVYGLAAGSCRWPTGDPRHPDFHFCGSPAAAGVYCARHHVMAHMHDTMERQESRRPEQPVRMVGIGNQGELHRTFSAAASL